MQKKSHWDRMYFLQSLQLCSLPKVLYEPKCTTLIKSNAVLLNAQLWETGQTVSKDTSQNTTHIGSVSGICFYVFVSKNECSH